LVHFCPLLAWGGLVNAISLGNILVMK
jgi:hypothetical protein